MALKNKQEYNAYMRVYMLARYHERRQYAINRLGGKCSACGSEDNLQLDHIHPEDKSFSLSHAWSVSMERFKLEVDKCQVLCKECHKEKSRAEGSYSIKDKTTTCACGRVFYTTKSYAGHRRWCRV